AASDTSTGTSLGFTVTRAVPAANTVIVTIAMDPASGTVTVVDSKGNTYTQDEDVSNGSGTTGVRTLVFSATLTTGLTTSDTITVTLPSVSSSAVRAFAVSGASVRDQTSTNTGKSTSTNAGTATTTWHPA